jgi:TusA-related sulfurtransferase
MDEYLDARNLPNPQPLVYTKRALAIGEFSHLIVHVSNESAKESVVRFARHAGFPVEKIHSKGGEFYITIANADTGATEPGGAETPVEGEAGAGDAEADDAQAGDAQAGDAQAGAQGVYGGVRPGTVLLMGGGAGAQAPEPRSEEIRLSERLFLALPSSEPLPSHVILYGTLLSRLCSDNGLRTAVEGLKASGVLLCTDSHSAEALPCGLPEGIEVLPSEQLMSILLSADRTISLF